MERLRHRLPIVLTGAVAFVAALAAAWAVTRAVRSDDTPRATVDRTAAAVAAPPLADELAPGTDLATLPGGGAPGTAAAGAADDGPIPLRASPVAPLGDAPAPAAVTPSLAAELRSLPVAEVVGAADAATPTDTTPSSTTAPTSTSTPAPDTAPSGGAPSFGVRFVDPCADRPSVCSALAGRPAVGGTIELTSDEPGAVEIRSLDVSSGTSDGCAAAEVADGRRAVGVVLNRPAALTVSWRRAGAAVGTDATFALTDAARDRFDVRRGTWRACLDVAFPGDAGQAAQATVTATADDGSTDSETVWAYDDDRRRITVVVVDDDELVAITPDLGDTTIGAVALRDDEDQVAGCRRAADRLLSERPRPAGAGEDPIDVGVTGTRLTDAQAAALVPTDGEWRAARFRNLRESQRYGICIYSVGSARGGRRIEATDAVLVQAPDREQYRVRPLELLGPGSIDGRTLTVTLGGTDEWRIVADTAERAEQDLPGSAWHTFGELPTAEVLTATVGLDGRRSEALVPLPARCVGATTCDPVGAARLVRLDIPGPDYTRRLCGTGAGSCGDGLRRRTEVLGSVVLLIERLEGRRGVEGWTIGGSRRFDADFPEPYWVSVDRARSGLRLAPDGTVSATVVTDVPSTLSISVGSCGGLAPFTTTTVEQAVPTTTHEVVFPIRLGEGGCAAAGFTVSDPTGARIDDGGELASVSRPAIRADVSVQLAVRSWPTDVPEGMGGEVSVGVNGSPRGVPAVVPRDRRFGCEPAGRAVPAAPSAVTGAYLGVVNTVWVHVRFVGRCADSGFPRIAELDATLTVPWSDLADGSATVDWDRPDGLAVRFTVTVTDVVAP